MKYILLTFLLMGSSFAGEFELLSEYSYTYCDENLESVEFDKCLEELEFGYVGEFIEVYLTRTTPVIKDFIKFYNETHKYSGIDEMNEQVLGTCSAMNVTDHDCNIKVSEDGFGNFIVKVTSFDTGE